MAEQKRKRQPQLQTSTRIVTAGNTVRIEPSKTHSRQPKKVTVMVTPSAVNGFIDFLREHAIVGLAVGFVIGTQVQAVVKQLVTSFITPAFDLLFGNNLTKESFTWHFHGRAQAFGWGELAYVLLNFLFVLIAIYAIIKLFKLDKLDKPKA